MPTKHVDTPICQNDWRLSDEPSIAGYGCLFTVLREMVEAHHRETLDEEDILDLYVWLLDNGGLVDEEGRRAFIIDHDKTGRAVQFYLRQPQTFKYVYRHDYAGPYKGFGKKEDAQYFAAYVRVAGYSIGHFIRCDSDGNRVWDPYWPPGVILSIDSIRGYSI